MVPPRLHLRWPHGLRPRVSCSNTGIIMTREEQAIAMLYDLGTREGATAANVRRAMKAAGFTEKEIAAAAASMEGRK